MDNGWIKISRAIADHWIFQNAEYFKWWIELIMMANWEDNRVLVGSKVMVLKRGEVIATRRYLAERWNVGERKIRTFLDLLESDGMIARETTTKMTKIIICNYANYQDCRPTNDQQTTNERPTNDQQKTQNKEYKERKERKEEKENYKGVRETPEEEFENIMTGRGTEYEAILQAWRDAYNQIFHREPSTFNDTMSFKNIQSSVLNAMKNSNQPTDHDSIYNFTLMYLVRASMVDPWVKDNFSPSVIAKQFDSLLNKIINGNGNRPQQSQHNYDDLIEKYRRDAEQEMRDNAARNAQQ